MIFNIAKWRYLYKSIFFKLHLLPEFNVFAYIQFWQIFHQRQNGKLHTLKMGVLFLIKGVSCLSYSNRLSVTHTVATKSIRNLFILTNQVDHSKKLLTVNTYWYKVCHFWHTLYQALHLAQFLNFILWYLKSFIHTKVHT